VRVAAALLLTSLLVAGCADDGDDGDGNGDKVVPGETATPTETGTSGTGNTKPQVIDTIATGLDTPWGLAFLPNGTAIVTERDSGRVLEVRGHGVRSIGEIDETSARGEAGLLGVAVSPSFASDHRLFFYVSTSEDNRIIRADYDGRRLGAVEPILTGIPNGFIHDGGRLAFGPDGYLYASTGETGDGELAQDRDSLAGKILRITQDGDPAPGNPDPGSAVWTWGHRNVQGLAFDSENRLWASEFGASEHDELNLIQKGDNYGWPIFEGNGDRSRYTNPHIVWRTDQASPSGLAFREGELWMASLMGERLWRIKLRDGRATQPVDYFVGAYGRLRTVVVAPDGNLWVTTSNRDGRGDPQSGDDRILVVRP
jgi:glucose/arabinose dehydrogenase